MKEAEYKRPSRKQQMPVIWAFRKFIHGYSGRSRETKEWKPLTILKELWELWGEKPKAKITFAEFREEHYKTIERLRGKAKKHAIRNGLLFELIRRFLAAKNVAVIEPTLISNIRTAMDSFSMFLPHGHQLPMGTDYLFGTISLYRLNSSEAPANQISKYLALRIPMNELWMRWCLVIYFDVETIDLEVGVYFFGYRELYLRAMKLQQLHVGRIQFDVTDPRYPNDKNVFRMDRGRTWHPFQEKPNERNVRRGQGCWYGHYERSNDAAALAQAELLFHDFRNLTDRVLP